MDRLWAESSPPPSSNISDLTYFGRGQKYMLSGGGVFNTPLLYHRIMQFLVKKIMEPYSPKLEGPI